MAFSDFSSQAIAAGGGNVQGYDYRFPHKYSKLLAQKQIGQKLRTALNEHRLGGEMLRIPYGELALDNAGYIRAAGGLLFEVSREQELDPRL